MDSPCSLNKTQISTITFCVCLLNHFCHVQIFETPWTVACQTPLSLGFLRQEYWSGLLRSPPGDLPNQRLNFCLSGLLHWQAYSLPEALPGKPLYLHRPLHNLLTYLVFVFLFLNVIREKKNRLKEQRGVWAMRNSQ